MPRNMMERMEASSRVVMTR